MKLLLAIIVLALITACATQDDQFKTQLQEWIASLSSSSVSS